MRKLQSTSKIGRLTPAQRATVESWMFAENMSNREVRRRIGEEMGVNLSSSSVNRYYHHVLPRWSEDKIRGSAQVTEAKIAKIAGDNTNYYRILLNRFGQSLFEKELDAKNPEAMAELRDSLRVLIAAQKEYNQTGTVALHREKWEFDVSRTCMAHLAELQEIMASNSLDEHARMQAIRKRLFGERPSESNGAPAPEETSAPANKIEPGNKRPETDAPQTQSRRDCGSQPRVARTGYPGNTLFKFDNPNGVVPCLDEP